MVINTVTRSEDRLQKLQNLAKQFNIPTEELVAHPQEDFQKALEYVLDKNKDLYQRLE